MAERGLLDLIIARLPGLSFPQKIRLCESFEEEQDIIRASRSDIEAILEFRLLSQNGSLWDIDTIRKKADRDEQKARQKGMQWVSWHSVEYPPLLREIYDPPVLLFFRGRLPNPQSPLAAVVGTRKPSPAAAAQAFDIAQGLGQNGISVVSGLATGIDSMAHRGNIEGCSAGMTAAQTDAPAATVAVLGSAVDEVYPSSNRTLARRVLETGGVLLSEYPPGTGPRKWTFPARNRIISGLSRGILIVEAPQKSGALITARFALEQNRDLWVASAGIMEGRFDRRGTKKLVQDGAEVIHSAADILKAWNKGAEK